jgi:hypothetical protein
MKLTWKKAALGIGLAAAVILTGGGIIGAALGVVGTAVGIASTVIGIASGVAWATTIGGLGVIVAKSVMHSSSSGNHALRENGVSNVPQRNSLKPSFRKAHDAPFMATGTTYSPLAKPVRATRNSMNNSNGPG